MNLSANGKTHHWAWWIFVAIALLVDFVFLPVSVLAFMWPSDGGVKQLLYFACQLILAAGFLALSRGTQIYARLVLAASLSFVLYCGWLAMRSYFTQTANFPWMLMVAVVVGLALGGWEFGQKWIACAMPVFVAWWLWTAFMPPLRSVPLEQTGGGRTLKLLSVTSRGCAFVVEPESRFHSTISARTFVGGGLPVHSFGHYVQSTGFYQVSWMVPKWARSVDISLEVYGKKYNFQRVSTRVTSQPTPNRIMAGTTK